MDFDDFGPVIGRRAEDEPRPVRILPCPCGEDAVWYFEPPVFRAHPDAPALRLSSADLPTNLCEGCFPLAVPETERDGWRRVPPADEANSFP